MTEIAVLLIHYSHLNHFQTIHVFNLTYGIIRERIATNLQFFQSLAVLQIEMTIWIIAVTILTLREAILSNHHSLQSIQSNQLHFIHILKTLITNLNTLQPLQSTHIKHTPFSLITAIRWNHKLRHTLVHILPFISVVNLHPQILHFQIPIKHFFPFPLHIPTIKQFCGLFQHTSLPHSFLHSHSSFNLTTIPISQKHSLLFIKHISSFIHGITIQHTHILSSFFSIILDHHFFIFTLLIDMEQFILLPHSTSQYSSTLLIILHSSSFSPHQLHIIKTTSVNHSISFDHQLQFILAILNTAVLLSTQPLPILTPQCFPLFIYCESTYFNSIYFFPTQLNDSLIEQ